MFFPKVERRPFSFVKLSMIFLMSMLAGIPGNEGGETSSESGFDLTSSRTSSSSPDFLSWAASCMNICLFMLEKSNGEEESVGGEMVVVEVVGEEEVVVLEVVVEVVGEEGGVAEG